MVTRSPKMKCFLKGKVSMSMSVELQNALHCSLQPLAPGQTKRGSHLLLATKSVDLISRGIILQYQRERAAGAK